MKRRAKGLTLIELMVTLAVAIVILAIGIPAFNAMTARDMSASTVNGLVAALQLARVEALSRSGAVSVVSADWNQGWSVSWTDLSGSTQVLRQFVAPRPAQVTVAGVTSPLTFNGSGETGTNNVFTVSAYGNRVDTSATPAKVRYVCVTAVGQVRTEDVEANCP